MELLASTGARVEYADPLIPDVEVAGQELKSLDLDAADPAEFDLVVVLVAREDLDLSRFLASGLPVFDAAYALAGGPTGRSSTC
jgi:UDP-N-acetyl-D-glucosamine dehydrogenase